MQERSMNHLPPICAQIGDHSAQAGTQPHTPFGAMLPQLSYPGQGNLQYSFNWPLFLTAFSVFTSLFNDKKHVYLLFQKVLGYLQY